MNEIVKILYIKLAGKSLYYAEDTIRWELFRPHPPIQYLVLPGKSPPSVDPYYKSEYYLLRQKFLDFIKVYKIDESDS